MDTVRHRVKWLALLVWLSLWFPAATAQAAFHLEYEDPTDHPTLTTRFVPATRIASVRIETERTYEQYQARQAARNAIPASIIECESGGSYTAENPTSSASGKYQMLISTSNSYARAHGRTDLIGKPASQWSPADQDAAAAWLWDGGRGRSHWAQCL